MRLFIAINFTDETRSNLLALRDQLREKSERGRFSLSENIHLTLAFLGECDDAQAAAAVIAMDSVTFEPFSFAIDCVGRFRRDGGDIWWAGIRQSKELMDLHQQLASALRLNGFNLEKQKYKPHITLGREIKTTAAPYSIAPFGETVSRIELMKSERVSGKLTYTPIYHRG